MKELILLQVKKLLKTVVQLGVVLLMVPAPVRADPGGGAVLRIAVPVFPDNLNPVYLTDETSQALANKIYHSLFNYDPRGRLVNELAADWRLVPEGVLIKLKRGFYFSDGNELGAGDVAATIGLLCDPVYAYPYRSGLEFIAGIQELDGWTVLLRFREQFAPWRSYLTCKILSAREISGLEAAEFRKLRPLGSGPFMISRVREPVGIELAANPFHPEKAFFSRLEYRVVLSGVQQSLKLLAGEVDAAELQPEETRAYRRNPSWSGKFRLAAYRKTGYTYLAFNLARPGLNSELRQTVRDRLFRSGFLEKFLDGDGCPVYSPFPPLADVGYHGAEPAMRVLPEKASLTITTNSESKLRRNLVLFLVRELAELNLELKPVFLEYKSFLTALREGRYDLAVSGFLLDADYDISEILGRDGSANYFSYFSPAMDELLASGRREMDPERRHALYLEAHRLWGRDLPFLPLFSLYYHVGISRKLLMPPEPFSCISACGDFFADLRGWRFRSNRGP